MAANDPLPSLHALVSSGAYELETTEYTTDRAYAPHEEPARTDRARRPPGR